MSLTTIQIPNEYATGNYFYPHFKDYAVWAVAESSVVDNFFNFGYKFKLNDVDGLVASSIQTPDINGNGSFNPTSLLNPNGEILNYATTSIYQRAENYFKEYQLLISEYYNDTENNEITLNKSLISGLSGDKTILDNPALEVEYSDIYFTHRQSGVTYTDTYNARGSITFQNGTIEGTNSDIKGFEFRIFYSDGTYKYYRYNHNITPYVFDSTSGLTDSSNLAVVLQTTIQSWIGLTFLKVNDNGTPTYVYETIDTDNISRYEIEPYNFSDALKGTIFKFDIRCSKEDINIVWVNQYGTLEYFPILGWVDNVRSMKATDYEHNNTYINSSGNYAYEYEDKHEKTIIDITKNLNYTLYTHIMTKEETSLLNTLWFSNKIYLTKGNSKELIPVESLSFSEMEKTKHGFFSYAIKVELAKIIK